MTLIRTRKRNFDHFIFMKHPKAFEHKCVIRCMFDLYFEDRRSVIICNDVQLTDGRLKLDYNKIPGIS